MGAWDIISSVLFFFFLLMFPRLSPAYILISQNCKKSNGNLHFVNL